MKQSKHDRDQQALDQAGRKGTEKVDIDDLADEKLPGGRVKISFSIETDFRISMAVVASNVVATIIGGIAGVVAGNLHHLS